MVENVWIDDGDTIINEWFVNYWVEYREIIESIYPKVHNEIDIMVRNRLSNK